MATQNPHKISKMDTSLTLTTAIRDDLDFPHAGLFRAMGQYAKGCFAVRGSLTDFDITLADNGAFTSVAVAAGKVFVHNKYVAVSALAAVDLNTSYADGGGGTNADLSPLVGTYTYLMIVYDSDAAAIKIRGSSVSGHNNYSGGKIPLFMNNAGADKPNDVPIAILRQPNDGDDDGNTKVAVQYLTTSMSENSVEIGFPTGSHPDKLYNQAMSITSDADGDVTIENHADDKDIIFKVSDGGVTKTLMTLDSSTPKVTILSDGLSTALDIQSSSTGSGSGPDLVLTRTGIADASGTPDGEQLGILVFRGEDDGGNSTEYARVVCYVDDVTDTEEDGRLDIATMTAGSTATKARFAATQITFYQNTLISGSGLDVRKDTDADFIALYLRNQSDAADTTGKVSLQFDLESSAGVTVDSGKIQVIKEQSFTGTASTQDASMIFSTSLNGTMTERMRLTSDKMGVNQGTPLSTLDVVGSNSRTITYHTSTGSSPDLTLGEHRFVVFNAGSGVAVNMPSIAEGRVYQCSNLGSGAVTFTRADSDTFYYVGDLTQATFVINQGQTVTFIGDESENGWHAIRCALA